MKQSSPTVIETHGLTKTFKGVEVLKSLDLEVHQNSIVGFLGPNGSGKTTTIKLLLGLIRPSSGSTTVFGMDSVKQSLDIRARIGYLPQEPRFYEHMTARQILNFTARFFFKEPRKTIEGRVNDMLQLVNLTDKADRPLKTFSGGEKQRLGIAQAQVNYPDLLILDEPAASLDPIGRRDVLEVISKLRNHTTVFYSTHILDDVQRVSDAVVILNKGQLVAQGSIEELLAGSESVEYMIRVRGAVEEAHNQVLAQPWIKEVEVREQNGETSWRVSVNDPQTAEAQLFKLLAEGPAVVTEYRRRRYDLEDLFMEVIEGGQSTYAHENRTLS